MKKAAAFAIIISLAIMAGCIKKAPPLTEIPFYKDFESAKTEAIKANKPMIIDFYTEWCKYCKMLDTITYIDSIIIAMSHDDIFVKIDAEADTTLAARYAVAGFPTIVITRPDGEEIDRIWGYMPPNEFYNQVQLYLQGKETLEDYLTRIQDEPDNPEYLMTIGEKYASRSETEKSIEFYTKVLALDGDNLRGLGSRAMAAIYDAQSRIRDYKAAIATCQELMTRFPTSREADDATAMLGYFTSKSGDGKSALALYREYLQKYPDGQNLWVKNRIADLEENL